MKKIKYTINELTREDVINKTLAKMTRKDLQIACVKKGLEFEKVVGFDNHSLSNWFYLHFDNGEDETLIPVYDSFVEGELIKRGYTKNDPIMSPCFRLGYDPKRDERNQTPKPIEKEQNVKPLIENRPKREKDEMNIVKGTKKSLTYKLTFEGKEKEEIIREVLKQFPDAQDKSIKIWIARAKKEMK